MSQVWRQGAVRSRCAEVRIEPLEGRRLLSAGAVGSSSSTVFQAPASAHAEAARPTVTATDPTSNKTNVRRDAFVAAYVDLPNVGHGIKESTLTSSAVK